jgi:hypothetical protein
MLQLRIIMKALLLVPFNAICAHFRLFVHGESAKYCHVYNVTLDTCELCINVFRHIIL